MNNKLLKKILYGVLALIQISIIVAVFVVQYLSDKKAGVMRHIYYRRYQFEQSILNSSNLNILSMVILIVTLILIALLISSIKSNKNLFYKVQITISILLGFMTLIVIKSNYFIEMLAYPYFIMAFVLVLILQITVVLISKIFSKNR